ncbi:MAG: hypothetical protein LQ338_006999 [Usnochroma carphineum]|nr:MAG: hypothetical protein LQ338_006999 [Usnochroma carphineum]
MATSNDLSQQTFDSSASARHPRHLPTPIITEHSKMALINRVDQGIMQPRPQMPLPSIGQIIDGHERRSSIDASSVRSGPPLGPAQTNEAWHDLPNTPRVAFNADEVMRKAMETMNEQIRANGFDPNNLPTRNPTHHSNGIHPAGGHGEETNEEVEVNLYQERADEIGLSHRIPGVGHLGDLLTPPGWKPGDEPISFNRARLLRHQAHAVAKKKLDDSIAEFKDLKGAAFQEASDLRNEEWQNLNDLSKLIFEERVKIWKEFQDWKMKGGQELVKHLPAVGHPPSSNSHPAAGPVVNGQQARHTHRPILPAITVSRPGNGFDRPEPSPKLLSPSFLDPNLVPGTVQAVIQGYHLRKAEIQRQHQENERQLNQCLTKFGPHLFTVHQPLQQPMTQATSNTHPNHQAAQQAPSTRLRLLAHQTGAHPGNENGQLNNRPVYGPTAEQTQLRPSYPTPPPGHPAQHTELYERSTNGRGTDRYHNENRALTAHRYRALPGQDDLDAYDEPTELALTPVKPQHHGQEGNDENADAAAINTPSKKKRAPTKKPTPKKSTPKAGPKSKPAATTTTTTAAKKQQPWYTAQLSSFNPPTSTITPEAIQAGLAYDPKGPPKPRTSPSKPATKKRRRGSDPVPVPEHKMPADKIKLLFKSGMPIRYTGAGPNPYLEDGAVNGGMDKDAKKGNTNAKKEDKGVPVAPATGNGEGSSNTNTEAKPAKVGSKDSPLLLDATPDMLSSGESTDDPNDGTYGAVGRKSGGAPPSKRKSPRKSVLAKRVRGGDAEEEK